jgi:hypothetical protein
VDAGFDACSVAALTTQNAAHGITLLAQLIMLGLVPGIHVLAALKSRKTWMAGTSPAMTKNRRI